ncbi:hypothetical protein BT67DRAFT_444699 [Trichocladium antarcticum]|uniref:AMMECR1 domain-containing protein n=1 Tax=Trichocladium antarcticum TaxID=1450529 RepID=A0AAN6UEZ7_9PEZI|nr:hypothetical protein BT67DRAFT_444699 [Trichocladium antarcticum]
MASVEHCLYCFEALVAHLEDRTPMTLPEVQKSWAEYRLSIAASAADPADSSNNQTIRPPALRRLADAATAAAATPSTTSSASTSTLSLGPSTAATSIASTPDPEPRLTASPLFVTWNTVSASRGPSLRGCIGTFETQPLDDGLASYALISALQDTRFRPVAARELPALAVAVTLLTDFEDAADARDWALGTHGLRIAFQDRGRRYGATYLPDVAVEQGWSKEETVLSLMRKAGWVGRKEAWRDVDLKVVRYQGRKQSLEYGEFRRWREWVGNGERWGTGSG